MKTVLLLAGLVAVALAGTIPAEEGYTPKTVDEQFVIRQKKILSLLQFITQVDYDADYYKIGKDFDIEANIDNYTNKKSVEEFLLYFRHGMIPKGSVFSVYNEYIRDEAIALYHLFVYAKDFDTFYKTAAWARVYLNEGLFVYSLSIAVIHREDTQGMVLPAPYEVYPYYFINSDVIYKMMGIKMQRYTIPAHVAKLSSISITEDAFVINANYSGSYNTINKEQKISYFTEDVGLNTYYYYFHISHPFWMNSERFEGVKERRGEYFFYFHQQLLARYYMERLTNGLGEIPQLSSKWAVKSGYVPRMVTHNLQSFVQRNNYYDVHTEDRFDQDISFLQGYESQFLEYLEQVHFKAYNTDVDLKNSKSINFVGNYWQSNADLYEKTGTRNYNKYYDILARVILGATPKSVGKYNEAPVALHHFQTALRDPVFFQLYKRIMYYFLEYKQYIEPYTRENLDFVGVKINDVKVDKLITFYDFFVFNASNAVFYSKEELGNIKHSFLVRQPRLDQKPFNVNIEVKSDVSTDATVKIFLGPKYDSQGNLLNIEENWNNFFELDAFKQKLTPGKNNIVRESSDFFYFKEDSISTEHLNKWLEQGKVPEDMSVNYHLMPRRLMLPKGTKGGFPLQMFVIVYPHVPLTKELEQYDNFFFDSKPLGFPFDRQVDELYFYQPNMYFKDVSVYHEGEDYVYKYVSPYYADQKNVVSKN